MDDVELDYQFTLITYIDLITSSSKLGARKDKINFLTYFLFRLS